MVYNNGTRFGKPNLKLHHRRYRMKYNYSKLLGRMRERGISQEQLAKALDKTESTLSLKLNNRFNFKTEEIDAISELLDIPNNEIGAYFFCKESLESQTREEV
jgi:transcriptional regulator with XRE-family HTH domain